MACASSACHGGSVRPTDTQASPSAPPEQAKMSTKSDAVADGRLEVRLEIKPEVVVDRVPMRTAVLHFRNLGKEPLRYYLPNGEAFRANISTLFFRPKSGDPLFVPEPHPHGYVVTEADFHLLEPGQAREHTQPFTIDPFAPGPGNTSKRMTGFEAGAEVDVRWVYENSIQRWKGGAQTLDGPTRELFDGGDIPYIWTGKLEAKMRWTVPR